MLVPNDNYKHPGPGYVYIMQSQSNPNEIKVGLSNDPKRRARELYRTNTPLPMLISAVWWVSHMEFAEKNIHTFLQDYRITNRREFFQVVPYNSPLYESVMLELAYGTYTSIESCLETLIEVIDDGLHYLTTVCSNFEYKSAQLKASSI